MYRSDQAREHGRRDIVDLAQNAEVGEILDQRSDFFDHSGNFNNPRHTIRLGMGKCLKSSVELSIENPP